MWADGVKTDKKLVLTASDNWVGSFGVLPKYADGKEIVYTITEDQVSGFYAPVVEGNAATGFTVTNTRVPNPGGIPKMGDGAMLMMASTVMSTSAGFLAVLLHRRKKDSDEI